MASEYLADSAVPMDEMAWGASQAHSVNLLLRGCGCGVAGGGRHDTRSTGHARNTLQLHRGGARGDRYAALGGAERGLVRGALPGLSFLIRVDSRRVHAVHDVGSAQLIPHPRCLIVRRRCKSDQEIPEGAVGTVIQPSEEHPERYA